MNRLFRKYHRWIAVILCLPLITTVLSGIGYTIADEWFHLKGIGGTLMSIHTFKVFHLEEVFPVLTGIGLIGLLVTGISMTGLFRSVFASNQTSRS